MKSDFKYQVILVNKIPYLTKLLGVILSVCFIICLVAWFLYFPATDSGNEMKTVAMINETPELTKKLMLFSGLGLIPLYFLYVKLRIRKNAFLLFNEDNIVIQTKNLVNAIPTINILIIKFHEPNLHYRLLSPKLRVSIQLFDSQNWNFYLKHYEQSDEVVDLFLSYKELKTRTKENIDAIFEIDSD
jgi:hypothetical protein